MDAILACIHCGFCLPACPTYEVLGDENDSPRGRIYLMRAVAEGRLAATDPAFALHIDQCLGCRACEPVCPSGVRYGFLLERAREARASAGGTLDRLSRFVLNLIIPRRWLQGFVWALARLLRATRVPLLIAWMGLPRAAPGRLRFAMAMLAATTPRRAHARHAAASSRRIDIVDGSERAAGTTDAAAPTVKVALLEGCVMSGLFRHVNRATERVVRAHGAETRSLPRRLCCGALHAHSGELEVARALARRMVDAFDATGAERLLTNSAGCGAALKEYGEWLGDDPVYSDKAAKLSNSVADVSEWLAGRPSPRFRSNPAHVGYDAPCHLLHAQGVADAPLTLLSRIPDLKVERLSRADRCCGGAGVYGLAQRRLSENLLQRKLIEVREAGVQIVATGNPGCIMQIGAGAITHRLPIDVAHPIELLDQALEPRQ
ncbi:MAG: heterodisulfide reductase-related iron-sulfur binding cluster [Gemmatimonadota bacterium]